MNDDWQSAVEAYNADPAQYESAWRLKRRTALEQITMGMGKPTAEAFERQVQADWEAQRQGLARHASAATTVGNVTGPVLSGNFYGPVHIELASNTNSTSPTSDLQPPTVPAPLSPLNPFFTSGLLRDPAQFFGRTTLLREIRAELAKRASVSLVGDSQTGKSSLLYYLAQTLPTDSGPVIYLDLQSVLDETDFCETLLNKLAPQSPTATLQAPSPRALKHALAGRAAILLLDELERLGEPDFSPRLLDLLRSLAQDPPHPLCLCVATRVPLAQAIPVRGPTSPFHNIFTTKTLGPFTAAEARAFLQTRLGATNVAFTERETAQLLTESRCFPGELQRLAKALFEEKQVNSEQ